MNKSTIEEVLAKSKNSQIILPLNLIGSSMKPLLREHKDTVLLSKPNGKLKKYDIALFKRKNGNYVLHRIVKTDNKQYFFCGDNQISLESGITDDMIIAVTKGIYRGEKYIPCDRLSYKIYSRIWVTLLPLRRLNFRIKERFKIIIKKLKRNNCII